MRSDHYQAEKDLTHSVLEGFKGQWDRVMSHILPEMATAISKGPKQHVECVLFNHEANSGGTSRIKKMRITERFADSCSVICTCTKHEKVSGPIGLVMAVRGCDFKTARQMIFDYAGVRTLDDARTRTYTEPDPRPAPPPDPEEERKKQEAIERTKMRISRIWEETIALDHPQAMPARMWLKRRGVWPPKGATPFSDLRLHRGLGMYQPDEKTGELKLAGEFPTLIGMMRDREGRTRGINRTYMTPNGLKPAGYEDCCRKVYAPDINLITRGSAVKLDDPVNGILNLAEGIETALAVRSLTGLPVWATLTANNLESVDIPSYVKVVTVWADKDRSNTGQNAADALVTRLRNEGFRAVALLPPTTVPEDAKGIDWNDLLLMWGKETIYQNLLYKSWWKRMQEVISSYATSTTDSATIIK